MNWEEKALCMPPFHGVYPQWLLGVKGHCCFPAQLQKKFPIPALSVFPSLLHKTNHQSKVRYSSALQRGLNAEHLWSQVRSSIRLFAHPLLWSDAQILASLWYSPSPHPPNEKLHLSATGTWSWQHLQTTGWAKPVSLKEKYQGFTSHTCTCEENRVSLAPPTYNYPCKNRRRYIRAKKLQVLTSDVIFTKVVLSI